MTQEQYDRQMFNEKDGVIQKIRPSQMTNSNMTNISLNMFISTTQAFNMANPTSPTKELKMTPTEAKKVIDEIDISIDQILELELDTDSFILDPLYKAQQLIFDSFEGDSYEELNSLFEVVATNEIDEEIFDKETYV